MEKTRYFYTGEMMRPLPHAALGMGAMWIPHGTDDTKEFTFIHPVEDPGTYLEEGKKVTRYGNPANSFGNPAPHGEILAHLLHGAYCYPEVRSEPINDGPFDNFRCAMRRGIWDFSQKLWTKNGVFVVDDPQAEGLEKRLDIKELEIKIRDGKEIDGVVVSNDATTRFAPKESYQDKCGRWKRTNNGLVLANYGQIGTVLLQKVSGTLKVPSFHIDSIDVQEGEEPVQTVSFLSTCDSGMILRLGSSRTGRERLYALECQGVRDRSSMIGP